MAVGRGLSVKVTLTSIDLVQRLNSKDMKSKQDFKPG